MKFCADHAFADVTLAQFAQLYFDEPFNEALCQSVAVQRTLLSASEEGRVLRRAVQIFPERTIPAPLARVLGAQRIGYTEHMEFDLREFSGTWRIESSVFADKVHSFGTLRFAADGARGVRRIVEGEVNVRIFAVGKTIERFIVADVQKGYDDAAAFTVGHLASHAP